MSIVVHFLLFVFSAFILWFFAGMLIEATNAVARRFKRSSFTMAFFVLGFLTSIGEIAVMTNSFIQGVPQIAVGNLIGSSFVTLLFIVPILAIVGRGVQLRKTLNRKHLALTLFVALLPALFVLDGDVRASEGVLCLLAYVTLFYFIEGKTWWKTKSNSVPEVIEEVGEELLDNRRATWIDALKIIGGAIIIFFAGNLLVEEAVYFSVLLSVPSSIIGLLLLSIGTNTPELVIAVRAIRNGDIGIAFGDYLGSTVAVTCIFGLLAILSGQFIVEASSFFFTTALMGLGFIAFYFFSHSKDEISRGEGFVLVSFYAVFLASFAAVQLFT